MIPERDLVAAIERLFGGPAHGVRVGIGDDGAVMEASAGDQVLSADVSVEGVHFDRGFDAARDIGYKAIVSNLSDLAAMGASPRFGVVSLVLSEAADLTWVVELAGGMREAADEAALSIVGGDLSSGSEIVVSVAVTGSVAPGRAILRSGAKTGDRLVVTGVLGAAAGGLALTRSRDARTARLAGTPAVRALLEAHARPVARVGEASILASHGVRAMMDVSDGLGIDLSRLCHASDVGARIDLAQIPVASGLEDLREPLGIDPRALALGGGEDFELLAAIPADRVEAAREELWETYAVRLSDIGEVTPATEGVVAVTDDGRSAPFEADGWEHFVDA